MADGAQVTGTLDGAVIGDGALVLGTVTRSVVWPGAVVSAGEHLTDAIRVGSSLTVPGDRGRLPSP